MIINTLLIFFYIVFCYTFGVKNFVDATCDKKITTYNILIGLLALPMTLILIVLFSIGKVLFLIGKGIQKYEIVTKTWFRW